MSPRLRRERRPETGRLSSARNFFSAQRAETEIVWPRRPRRDRSEQSSHHHARQRHREQASRDRNAATCAIWAASIARHCTHSSAVEASRPVQCPRHVTGQYRQRADRHDQKRLVEIGHRLNPRTAEGRRTASPPPEDDREQTASPDRSQHRRIKSRGSTVAIHVDLKDRKRLMVRK